MPAARQRRLADGRKQATERTAETDSEADSELETADSDSDSNLKPAGPDRRARGSLGNKEGPEAVEVLCPGCKMAFPSSIALRSHINSRYKQSTACGLARRKQRRPTLRRSSRAEDSDCTDPDIRDLFDDAMAEGNNYDVPAGSMSSLRGGLPSSEMVRRGCI